MAKKSKQNAEKKSIRQKGKLKKSKSAKKSTNSTKIISSIKHTKESRTVSVQRAAKQEKTALSGETVFLTPNRREFLKTLLISMSSAIGGVLGGAIGGAIVGGRLDREDLDYIVNKLAERAESIGNVLKVPGRTLYPVKRKIADALEIMDKTVQSLHILGINSLGPLHQGMEEIKRILDAGGDVKVLLLDSESEVFKKREQQECKRQIDGAASLRLTKEWEAALEILKDLNLRRKKGNLELRVHSSYPECALVIGDGTNLQYNEYPTVKKPDLVDSELPRGVSGDTFIYNIEKNQKEFERCVNYFQKLWESAREVRFI